jgi:hypothetical protein
MKIITLRTLPLSGASPIFPKKLLEINGRHTSSPKTAGPTSSASSSNTRMEEGEK